MLPRPADLFSLHCSIKNGTEKACNNHDWFKSAPVYMLCFKNFCFLLILSVSQSHLLRWQSHHLLEGPVEVGWGAEACIICNLLNRQGVISYQLQGPDYSLVTKIIAEGSARLTEQSAQGACGDTRGMGCIAGSDIVSKMLVNIVHRLTEYRTAFCVYAAQGQ